MSPPWGCGDGGEASRGRYLLVAVIWLRVVVPLRGADETATVPQSTAESGQTALASTVVLVRFEVQLPRH